MPKLSNEAFTSLINEVQSAETVLDGAVALILGIPKMIADAIDRADTDEDVGDEVTKVVDDLKGKVDALTSAMATKPDGSVAPVGNLPMSGAQPADGAASSSNSPS